MRILEINIQNFRKLLQCHIEVSKKTTLFVGANNSGKTSAMDALGKFLADRNFTFNDITISERSAINAIGERWIQKTVKNLPLLQSGSLWCLKWMYGLTLRVMKCIT